MTESGHRQAKHRRFSLWFFATFVKGNGNRKRDCGWSVRKSGDRLTVARSHLPGTWYRGLKCLQKVRDLRRIDYRPKSVKYSKFFNGRKLTAGRCSVRNQKNLVCERNVEVIANLDHPIWTIDREVTKCSCADRVTKLLGTPGFTGSHCSMHYRATFLWLPPSISPAHLNKDLGEWRQSRRCRKLSQHFSFITFYSIRVDSLH